MSLDSEYLRDWLVQIMNMSDYIEKISSTQPFDTKIPKTDNAKKLVNELLKSFDAIVRDSYGEVNPQNAYLHYAPLFDLLDSMQITSVPIFTTNYDLVFECMDDYENKKWEIETGMKKTGRRVVLDTKLLDDFTNINQQKVIIYKLHGSTNWWKNETTGQIEQVPLNFKVTSEYKDLLIYPTRKEFSKISQKPFSFFYNKLKQYLTSEENRVGIVIGYSFRDRYINEIICPAIKTGMTLIIIDPFIKEKQLVERFSEFGIEQTDFKNRVKILNIEFGKWSDGRDKAKKFSTIITKEIEEVRNQIKPNSEADDLFSVHRG